MDKFLENDLSSRVNKEGVTLVQVAVFGKERIVQQDPKEQGLRKALNLGHTVGHACESFAHEQGSPIPHGYAVAWGLVCELLLSHLLLKFPLETVRQLSDYVKRHYGVFSLTCKEYDTLYQYMRHDKKNANADAVNFSLMKNIAEFQINQEVEKQTINTAFALHRDLMVS